MAGVTDSVFRTLTKQYGCEYVFTEMVSAKALLHENERTHGLLRFNEEERPLSIQLFGHDPKDLAEAAAMVEALYRPDGIDINMGCPAPKIVKNGDGAALLLQPELAFSIARAVVDAVSLPVSAKIRIGWDCTRRNGLTMAKGLQDAGISSVAVHGRTRSQFYSGDADWRWIEKIKACVSIPVIGNGDIVHPRDGQAMMEQTGCDHIMVGRAALGNPWFFRQLEHYLKTGELLPGPDMEQRCQVAMVHAEAAVGADGTRAMRRMRSHLAWYFKGVPGGAALRKELTQVSTLEELKKLLRNLYTEV